MFVLTYILLPLFFRGMKRILSYLIVVCISAINSLGMEFSYSIPANNSEISAFNIEIIFNIEDALSSYICDDYGIYVSGSYSEKTGSGYHTKLYKGTIEDGEIIGRALTANITATSSDFEQGNSLHLSFVGVTPEPGQLYTLALYNKFNVTSPTLGGTAGTVLNCNKNPIILTFIGASASEDELVLQNSSITANETIVSLTNVSLGYNESIQVCEGATNPYIVEEGNVYSTATLMNVDSEDATKLNITFNEVEFPVKRNFTLVLPEGSVCLASNESVKNDELRVPFIGGKYEYFEIGSITPENHSVSVPPAVNVIYNLPEGMEFRDDVYYTGTLYKVNDGERELIQEIKNEVLNKGKDLRWTFKNEFIPEATYEFEIPKGTIFAYVTDWSTITGYKKIDTMSNDDILIRFTTPTVENANLPVMEFGDPRVALNQEDGDIFENGSAIYEMNGIAIPLKNKYYIYQGSSVKLAQIDNGAVATMYKETEEGLVALKELPLTNTIRYTADDSYRVIYLAPQMRFYEGETYKLVIPAGVYTVNSEPLKAYVKNPELVYTYTGTAEGTLKLTCASIREGERLTTLSAIAYHTDQELVFTNENPRAYLRDSNGNDKYNAPLTLMVTTHKQDGVQRDVTRVVGDFSNFYTMQPYTLPEDEDEFQVVLPAGTLCLANDTDIKNAEIVVNIKRVEASGIPEYINLTTVHSDHLTTVLPVEKGLKATIHLTPDSYWKVDALTFNGKDVTDDVNEDGSYTTSALRINSRLEASLAFDGNLEVSDETGVATLGDANVRIYSDGDLIVVENLTPGTEVTVYSISGHVLKSHTAARDVVKVSAPRGAVYVVRVGNEAAKIQH